MENVSQMNINEYKIGKTPKGNELDGKLRTKFSCAKLFEF